MRIAILGGAFDPIHNGHVAMVTTLLAEGWADEVYVIPSRQHPPHKPPAIAPVEDRLAMCKAALASLSGVRILTLETDEKTQGYTVQTLAHLHQLLSPDIALSLAIGTDNFLTLHTWRNPRGVLGLARLLVIGRSDQTAAECQAYFGAHFSADWTSHVDWVGMSPIDISSSVIRTTIRSGQSVATWLPPSVSAYIDTLGLYR